MAGEETTILQHWILTNFILPFLLMFFVVFAILEKTNLLGKDKKQVNAMVAFVIGLIFVGAVFPKLFVSNLILFLTVSITVVFVVLMLWGFVSGGEAKIESKGVKIAAAIVIVFAVIMAIVWATDSYSILAEKLFKQSWSNTFWTSLAFIVVIAIALALVLTGKSGK